MHQLKTHREVKDPQISARYLADYMAASERTRRTIVRDCKYQPIARVMQHKEARAKIGNFIRTDKSNTIVLIEAARQLRDRLADSDFERDLFDHNAEYIERFANRFLGMKLPEAEYLEPGKVGPIDLEGVKVTIEICARLRRLTRTNKVRVGMAALRYAKNKPLSSTIGAWQSAFLYGLHSVIGLDEGLAPEHKLCITIDASAGKVYPAPTDSVRRFQNMEAACATIAERWPNIEPPPNAVI